MQRHEALKTLVKYLINYRGRRAEHARHLFFLLAGRFTPVVLSAVGPALYYVRTSDDTIGREVFMRGSYDEEVARTLFATLDAVGHGSVRGKTLVDIGGNIGTNAIHALVSWGFPRAVVFEPAPDNWELLQLNLQANGLEERVAAYQAALSDREGEAALSLLPCPGHHFLRAPDDAPAVGGDHPYSTGRFPTVRVPTRTLDALVRDGVVRPDEIGLVWIDVQGHEGHILDGAHSLLARGIPVVMELYPGGLEALGGLERIERLIPQYYTHVFDLRVTDGKGRARPQPATEIGRLVREYPEPRYTDLLLLRVERAPSRETGATPEGAASPAGEKPSEGGEEAPAPDGGG